MQVMQIVGMLLLSFIYMLLILTLLSAVPLCGVNLFFLIRSPKTEKDANLSIFLGVYSFLGSVLLTLLCVREDGGKIEWKQWYVELSSHMSKHTPLSLPYIDTFIVLILTGITGYVLLAAMELSKTPPLLVVLAMAMVYIGGGTLMVWSVQTIAHSLILSVLPVNYVLASGALLRRKMAETDDIRLIPAGETHPVLGWMNRMLSKSRLLPLYGLMAALPLLGIIIAVLLLFGQRYDAVIRMWTETSDWTLSACSEPTKHIVNVDIPSEDGHYLCTVAAGGHPKLVKPQRRGMRHGREIVVNRQLCVANAFEQILEEKTPRLHKAVRHFYDTYGLPVAKCIRKPWTADLVYWLMKPLEWVFLIVLYAVDVQPEKRIAVQYLPKSEQDQLLRFLENAGRGEEHE